MILRPCSIRDSGPSIVGQDVCKAVQHLKILVPSLALGTGPILHYTCA